MVHKLVAILFLAFSAVWACPQNSSEVSPLLRRAYSIDPTNTEGQQPWPNGRVLWCVMEESYLIELYELMTAAWALWNDAIGGTAMSILNVEFSWETCPSEANGYYLRVAKTDQKAAKCSPGWNRGTGGSLEIDTSSDWGTMNSAVNLAHELGHAFGLYHEHQKPSAWISETANGGTGSTDLFAFKCSNLKDYEKIKAEYGQEGIDKACKSQGIASRIGFTADQFLPYQLQLSTAFSASFDFDWDSIMLYGSTIGGKQGFSGKQPVLKKKNRPFDKTIEPNMKPSRGDVNRIRLLYPPSPQTYISGTSSG